MRSHGTLVKWNDDRGFGFILPSAGIEEVFVHISAFPRGEGRPRVDEVLSFDIEFGDDGKRQAKRVMRPGKITSARTRRATPVASKLTPIQVIAGILVVVAVSCCVYFQYFPDNQPPTSRAAQAIHNHTVPLAPAFSCDGRTRCSQMKSCAEANFFFKQCPGTQMDGDGDGKPCESQWCGYDGN